MSRKHKSKATESEATKLTNDGKGHAKKPPPTAPRIKPEIVIVTTALLGFISFWRAAAIVLCDLGSSAFYAGGIAERAIGKAAPWFILAVMLFSYAVRAVYVES